ncbi:MAG: response regulator transcription factor [Deltaproteobacteria bacterium]
MRILIAEDDPVSRTMLVSMLKNYGHEVVATTTGMEAWQEMQKPNPPPMALIDWMMPEMEGLEVVRHIRTLESEQQSGGIGRSYIIMLTSRDEMDDIIAGLNSGADDYLVKPFHMGVLRARIDVGHRMIRIQKQLALEIRELKEAQEHIRTLQGILPICMHCKNIRNDTGYWEQIDQYVSKHSQAMFSHGICPECLKKHYPEYFDENYKDIGAD